MQALLTEAAGTENAIVIVSIAMLQCDRSENKMSVRPSSTLEVGGIDVAMLQCNISMLSCIVLRTSKVLDSEAAAADVLHGPLVVSAASL